MRGKDDEKLMKPLFPRVHVRDTEKGWPKAPPRNKMALYEHVTVSSQKFNHGYFYPANGNANAKNLQFPIQQVPPEAPVRVSRECNGLQPETASVLSSSSRHILRKGVGDDDGYMIPVLGNSNADIVQRESNAEIDAGYEDDETGMNPERSKESITLDDDCEGTDPVVSDTLDISVDDVVGTIGRKCFWKAKNAISNQQKLFAKQVFELHRLIKVQRVIAESPDLLFNNSTSLRKSSPKQKHLAPGFLIKPLPRYAGFKSNNHKANNNHNIEGSAENSPGRSLPIAQCQNVNLPSDPDHRPANTSPAMPATTEPMCCFQQPPGHPWLVPVMSPSAGLIYKPCLSLPGFTSGCGGCGHSNNFASMAFGFPSFPQQQGICSLPVAHPVLGHFPPYGLPIPDPGTYPAQHMDQMTHPNPPSSLVHPSSLTRTETINIFQDQGSCNLPTQETATSLEVSTADTSSFPLNPRELDETKVTRPGRVIRAVPCNPRLATESAARIFCSIQEERRQF